MSHSINTNKSKMIQLVCKKYITVDSNGEIAFKSYLNQAIERGDVSKMMLC